MKFLSNCLNPPSSICHHRGPTSTVPGSPGTVELFRVFNNQSYLSRGQLSTGQMNRKDISLLVFAFHLLSNHRRLDKADRAKLFILPPHSLHLKVLKLTKIHCILSLRPLYSMWELLWPPHCMPQMQVQGTGDVI